MIRILVPASKSVTQRALALAALGHGPCRVRDPLDCDDSRAMIGGLRALGAEVDVAAGAWTLRPAERLTAPTAPLHLGNAGTAVRFLTGLAPLVPGPVVIDGDPAMHRRPMPALLPALRTLGVVIEELGAPDCPPVRLDGSAAALGRRDAPPVVPFTARHSSQELSALLLMGAALPGGVRVHVDGDLPSRPYVDLTVAVLDAFGVAVSEHAGEFRVAPGGPRATEYAVEGDWSSASYPLAAGWLTGREVEVTNAVATSVQGDRVFPELLARIAAPGPREINLKDAPDLAPTVTACALFADGETAITGAAHLRVKESDRIAVLVRELARLGADLEEREDGLVVRPAPLAGPAALDPTADHRMAMAFGLVGLRVPGVEITDPGCVSKSYPDFWAMLEAFR